MENRISERLENGQWSVVTFKDLIVGDVMRVDDIPEKLWRVDEAPHKVVGDSGIETMAFLASPYSLP